MEDAGKILCGIEAGAIKLIKLFRRSPPGSFIAFLIYFGLYIYQYFSVFEKYSLQLRMYVHTYRMIR